MKQYSIAKEYIMQINKALQLFFNTNYEIKIILFNVE